MLKGKPKPESGDAGQEGQQPQFKENPQVNAKIDEYIKNNPKFCIRCLREHVALSRGEVVQPRARRSWDGSDSSRRTPLPMRRSRSPSTCSSEAGSTPAGTSSRLNGASNSSDSNSGNGPASSPAASEPSSR